MILFHLTPQYLISKLALISFLKIIGLKNSHLQKMQHNYIHLQHTLTGKKSSRPTFVPDLILTVFIY